jgi:hypothetical protein
MRRGADVLTIPSGEKILLAKEVVHQKDHARVSVTVHSDKAASAESNIRSMQKQLDRQIDRVSRAQDELDHLLSFPPIYEPTHYDDLRAAHGLSPATNAPSLGRHIRGNTRIWRVWSRMLTGTLERGWIASTANAVFGFHSRKYRDEDAAYAKAHRNRHERRQHNITAEEKARRNADRKRAEAKLEEARHAEASLHDDIEKAVKELSLNEDKLADAKAGLAKANTDLKRLGNQELELISVHFARRK